MKRIAIIGLIAVVACMAICLITGSWAWASALILIPVFGTALAADKETVYDADRVTIDIPVAAGETIYLGAMVTIDSSGNAKAATDTAGEKFAGVSLGDYRNGTSTVDNSTGAAAALWVRVRRVGVHELVASGLTKAHVGDPVYVSDDQTVTRTPTNIFAGYLVDFEDGSTTVAIVDITPATRQQHPEGGAAGQFIDCPVAATTTIAANDLVGLNSSGYLIRASTSGCVKFVGVAREAADNSAGANGDLNSQVDTTGIFNMTGSGLTQADAGKRLYASAAQTVTTTYANGLVYVGRLAYYSSATVAPLLISDPSAVGEITVSVGVAATKTITRGSGVCLDGDGYLVDMDDATALSFWGVALEAVDNSAGADGDLEALVRRSGVVEFTGAGLVAGDAGKEVWQVTNDVTITTTPGDILVGVLEYVDSATAAHVRIKPMPIIGQRTDRQHLITFAHSGATLNGKSAFTDREFKRKYIPLSMHFAVETAPGGTDTLTCTLTDGTNTFAATATGAAVFGENKTPAAVSAALKANFDTDLTLTDSSTTTADVKGEILVEDL